MATNANKLIIHHWQPKFWPMWILIGSLRLTALLPYRMQIQLGKMLGWALEKTPGLRQQVVDKNLQHCFPELSSTERQQIKNCFYQNIGISLLEFSMCWWWSEQRLRPLVEIRGQQHVDAALASGRGVILLAGHFTNLEIGARLVALYMPIQVMYQQQGNPLFNHYLSRHRSRYFAKIVPRTNIRALIQGIKNQIPTWYAPDQNSSYDQHVFAPFMGIDTATITASARLAQSSGAMMMPFHVERRTDHSGYTLWIEPPLDNFPSDDAVQDASQINASIEKVVRQHPAYYFWMHRRFKTRPEGAPDFYA